MDLEENKVNIVLADSQYLTRKGLENILNVKFEISSIFSRLTDLLKYLETNPASLIILDFDIFEFDIPGDLKSLLSFVPNILMLTNSLSQMEFEELTKAGIKNIILKSADEYELFQAIDATLIGKKYYSESILEMLIEISHKKNFPVNSSPLTFAEMEIVKLISEGLTTKQIAAQKFISIHTVITHKKNIFRKIGVNSVSELIMYAIRAGWIDNIEYYI
jgi:DNA-binding NarL/FixJ family response regulator